MRRFALAAALALGGLMNAEAANRIAVIETSMGTITAKLYDDKTPNAVANFVDLATGKKEWTDPATGKPKKSNYYDGLTFHRVIPNFMIQGGDPEGTGRGGPGYSFNDEIKPELKFDKPGKLAMANRGPNTNGSQFFITVAATPWLDGGYTMFGEVIDGQAVADAISKLPRDGNDKPNTPVTIKKVTIKAGK